MLVPGFAALFVAAAVLQSPDTSHYVVLNHGRPAGSMTVVRTADSIVVRYGHIDRNRGRWVENRYRVGTDGELLAGQSQILDRHGNPGAINERFEVGRDSVRWTLGTQDGAARPQRGTFYRVRSGTGFDQAWLARTLLAQPEQSARLLPQGAARAEIVSDTVVSTSVGPQRVRYVAVNTGGSTPMGVWLDERGELFATDAGWFITVRRGAEMSLPTLRAIEMDYRDSVAAAIAHRLHRSSGTVVIRNGDLFDSEQGVMRPRTTVVIEGDRIVAVGAADEIAVPAGATVIDATGKTVMPGMWDMHTHLQMSSATGGALQQLALGITTVRDLAADTDVAVSHRDRAAAGTIVSPRVILGGFIEGPGLWAGPSEVLVRTENEAREWVARYDSLGYRQIKLYNLLHPDLVPVIAEETRRRGLLLSGHIPRGMSIAAAVALGFQEINHAAFFFSNFFQDSLYVPEMRPYSAVAARVAPNVDVDGPEMSELIDFLAERGTVVDGTFSIWLTGSSIGSSVTGGAQSSDGARADSNYVRLIKRLYDAGVPLVPGTDAFGSNTFHAELELYERAGIPAPAVLQIATIGSARVMKEDANYGSIAPGKVADIIVVDGRPSERVADIRKVERVIRAGRVYDPAELREVQRGSR